MQLRAPRKLRKAIIVRSRRVCCDSTKIQEPLCHLGDKAIDGVLEHHQNSTELMRFEACSTAEWVGILSGHKSKPKRIPGSNRAVSDIFPLDR